MSAFRRLRNRATRMNREAKTAYFSDRIQASQGDLKETWATINKLVNKRSKTTNIKALEVDSQNIDDPVGMANSMNEFFSNIGVKLCKDIPDTENDLLNGDYDINPTKATILFTPIESEQVITAMLWKIARIAPIHKADATLERSNYRPITVLPVLSRLFEKLVYDQLYNYLISNEMQFSRQSTFRKLHSVLTCLLKCTND